MRKEWKFAIAMLAIPVLAIVYAHNKYNTKGIVLETVDPISVQVYEVCNYSRTTDKIPEEECGRVQDENDRLYLCKERNRSLLNTCWVERVFTQAEEF